MHKTFLKILYWSWITLHAAIYLIGAGAALRFFDLFGMSLWLVLGWIALVPTLILPELFSAWWHRSRQRSTVEQKSMPQAAHIDAPEEEVLSR